MRQGSLFDIPSQPEMATRGVAGLLPAMRAAMNYAAGKDEGGRKILVDKINDIAEREVVPLTSGGGKSIKKDQLDKWLQSAAAGHAPSLEAIVCFCLATGDASPIKPLLEILGLAAIPKDKLEALSYGESCIRLKKERELGMMRGRNSFRIKESLDKRGLTLTALAEDMGLSVNAISKVINGYSHSGRILDRLRKERVPERYLYDPRRLLTLHHDN